MQTAMIDRDLIAIHKAGCANGNGAEPLLPCNLQYKLRFSALDDRATLSTRMFIEQLFGEALG
jgi:hypothetical protein